MPPKTLPMTIARLLLTLALAAPGSPRRARPRPSPTPTASKRASKPMPRLTVGDRFDVTYVVTTRHPRPRHRPLADSLAAFVVAKEERKSVRRGDLDETTYELALACFQPGRQTLPGLRFTVSFGEQGDTLTGDTVSVTIASVLPDSMKDVNGLKPAETFPNYWLWLIPAILALVGVLAWMGWKLYRRLKRLHEAVPPPLPAWEEALGALDRLPWPRVARRGAVQAPLLRALGDPQALPRAPLRVRRRGADHDRAAGEHACAQAADARRDHAFLRPL
jgi:hypothetical protein